MKNNIDDLRNHLFAAIEMLQDKDSPMDIERAKAISEAAQVIVNSAKVEVDYMKVAGGTGTGFLPAPLPRASMPKRIPRGDG